MGNNMTLRGVSTFSFDESPREYNIGDVTLWSRYNTVKLIFTTSAAFIALRIVMGVLLNPEIFLNNKRRPLILHPLITLPTRYTPNTKLRV